jgi:hypothetical protein
MVLAFTLSIAVYYNSLLFNFGDRKALQYMLITFIFQGVQLLMI